MVSQINER